MDSRSNMVQGSYVLQITCDEQSLKYQSAWDIDECEIVSPSQ